jgi:hypothetical protein
MRGSIEKKMVVHIPNTFHPGHFYQEIEKYLEKNDLPSDKYSPGTVQIMPPNGRDLKTCFWWCMTEPPYVPPRT